MLIVKLISDKMGHLFAKVAVLRIACRCHSSSFILSLITFKTRVFLRSLSVFFFFIKRIFFVCIFPVEGHDSSEDASACMELMVWKIKEDAKVKRWPLTSFYSASFRSSSRPPALQKSRSMCYRDVRKNLFISRGLNLCYFSFDWTTCQSFQSNRSPGTVFSFV